MRPLLTLVLVLAAGAGVYLLLSAPDGAKTTREQDVGEPQDTPTDGATLQGSGTRKPEAPESDDPYAEETDWEVIGRGLWLNSDRENAVKRAVELLRGKPDEIRALMRRLHPDAGESQHSGQAIFRGVAQTLVALGPENLDMLLEELGDANAVYRTRVVAVIGSFEKDAGRVVPALLERFHAIDEEPPAGECASYINAFRFIGPAAKDVLPILERWIDEGATSIVEVAAIRALGQIGGPTEAVFERYLEVLRAEDWRAQRSAALKQIGDWGKQAESLIPRLLELVDENVLSEEAVIVTCAHIGVPHPDVLARAEKGLRAVPKEWETLGWHAYALARLGDEGFRRLMAVVEERGLRARALLAATLKQAGFDHERIFRLVRPALAGGDPKVRSRAWHLCSELERLPLAAVESDLLRALDDVDRSVRRMAIYMSSRHGTPSRAVAQALLARVENTGEDGKTRLQAAGVLTHHLKEPPERLYNALLALHRADPKLDAEYHLHPWLGERTALVLRIWSESLGNPLRGPMYARFVQRLPVRVRRQHADAIRLLGLDPETGKPLKPVKSLPLPR